MSRKKCWFEFGSVVILMLAFSGCGKAPKADQQHSESSTTTKTPNVSSEISSVEKTPQKPGGTAVGTDPKSKSSDTESQVEDLTREQLLVKITTTQEAGMQKIAQKKVNEGYGKFVESGRYADQLQKTYPELSAEERMHCSNAFYNHACALSMLNDPAAAAEVMKRAIATGYDDFDNLDRDTDLVQLRQLPQYASLREEWEKSAAVQRQAAIAAELAEFHSYPFDFTLPNLDEMPVKLADYSGKVVIVDIWGTWCPPCRAEIPHFVKLQSKYGDQGLQIVGLNYERAKNAEAAIQGIRTFIESNNMNYPCLIGDNKTQAQVPSFRGYPTTLFLDRTGKVRMQFVGAHSYGSLESVVLALLAENAK